LAEAELLIAGSFLLFLFDTTTNCCVKNKNAKKKNKEKRQGKRSKKIKNPKLSESHQRLGIDGFCICQ